MIKALNEPPEISHTTSDESSNDESGGRQQQTLSKEALEEQYFDKYRQALLAIQNNKKDEAKDLLEELEDTLDGLKSPADDTLMQLKFSVLRNLGNLVPNDVDHYVEALELDATDISLWIKLGDRCLKLNNYPFARICYEQALSINSNNWIAIERLIELYYILHLPFELYDICSRAIMMNRHHRKASLMLREARNLLPFFCDHSRDTTSRLHRNGYQGDDSVITVSRTTVANTTTQGEASMRDIDMTLSPLLALKRKRQHDIQADFQKFKRTKLCITLDTARTQSLASFGNYIIKIYERFSKQFITRNTMIDITINNTTGSFSQQFNSTITSTSNQNQSSEGEQQTLTCSQDVDLAVAIDINEGASDSQNNNDKTDCPTRVAATNEQTNTTNTNTSTDDNDQTKSNGQRNRPNNGAQSSQSSSQTPASQSQTNKGSSLSFAALLFPTDLNDKRRSSRNRSNQDDTFSFKMKFDELNELLPECLRIGAIEQVLQKRREEQQLQLQQQLQQQQDSGINANGHSNEERSQQSIREDGSISIETNLDPVREDQIIKDVIEEISGQAKASGTMISNIKLCDIFYVYLSKLASKKQNSLPDAFIKIYKVYRRMCPLPSGCFIEIGRDGIRLEELWFMLTANEVTYQHQECAFMMRILEQLQIHLDEAQHREFLVRLLLVIGMNSDYRYLEVALQSIEEDVRIYASNRKIVTRAHIKTLIDRKTEKLQEEVLIDDSNNSIEIIDRLAPKSENEMSDREIQVLCQAITSAKLWQRGLDIINQRNDLNSDIIIDTINICLKNGAKMDAILSSKLCKEAISGTRPTTWSSLYRGWLGTLPTDDETDLPTKSDRTVSDMDKFFDLGHQTLGKKCTCTIDKGEFLMLHVEHLLDDDRDTFEERDFFGSTSCLFGYPNKKPAAVASHKATRVPILWDYGQIIYQYLSPDTMPTYMSLLRKAGITNEVEVMFREIAEATPAELNPRKSVHIIENFIELGEPLTDLAVEKNDVTQDLFYLLADYYFKNKDFKTAKLYYHYDLVINPDRFDSWAASGLIRASGIDKALSEGAITTQDFVRGFVRNLADSAIRCFEQATKLKPREPKATLWIEFGNLTYNLMSLASRLYIYDDFENDTTGRETACLEELFRCHKKLWKLTKHCFTSANELCACDEVWLHYYMLGKIYEKTNTLQAIDYYHKADAQLFIEGASYPKKISYHNPPELAYEAMEVHYRIHAAALKYLTSKDNISQANLDALRRSLVNAQRSPFVLMIDYNDPIKSIKDSNFIAKEVSLVLDDTIDMVARGQTNLDELVFMCLHGMKRCLVRCDKNFKALYRLAFSYRNDFKRPQMAQKILMSKETFNDEFADRLRVQRSELPDFMVAPPDLRGVDSLFKDRKIGNLFFGIWRMPIEEIDRPGCFEHWMFKCTHLLINTCFDLKDTTTLTTIAFQLSRTPETSKRYLQDRPRVLLAEMASKQIVSIIMDSTETAPDPDSKRACIREGMVLADRFVKSNVFFDKMRKLYNDLSIKLMESMQGYQQ